MEEKKETKQNYFSMLNKLVLRSAIKGSADCLGPITISWNTEDRYVLVFVEEYTGKRWYRVFISQGQFLYERNRVLYPWDDSEDLSLVYEFYEDLEGEKKAVKNIPGFWQQQIMDILKDSMDSHE